MDTVPKILVVDDNREIRDLLASYLEKHHYQVLLAQGGVEMRALLEQQMPDLVVLDLMMPGEDGLSLCRHVREIDGPPVIMLTAMSDDADCIVGLEMGADDYVTKPFVPRVLLARIKALLRRQPGSKTTRPQGSPQSAEREVVFGEWRLDLNQRALQDKKGLLVPLSTAEFTLLKVFLEHPQQVLSRDQLLTHTKGREANPFDRSIDNQVSRLRKKLERDPQHPEVIKTVWGGGYLFAPSVGT